VISVPGWHETGERKNAKEDRRKGKVRPRRTPQEATPIKETVIKIRIRSQVNQYSRVLIAALDYDHRRHLNQPPPELRIDDDGYIREIRNLIAEFQTLNLLLKAKRRDPKRRPAPS
jgi:hypothetical protein